MNVFTRDFNVAVLPCPTGAYCPANTTLPVPCPAGTYNPTTGGNALSSCLACGYGYFCPYNSSWGTPCAPGTYNDLASASACTTCPAGAYCPQAAMPSALLCPQGTYNPAVNGTCLACTVGTYSATTNRTSMCAACPANSACTAPDTIVPCPPNTESVAGSASVLSCTCMAGFLCTYSKRLVVRVTLSTNETMASLQNNTDFQMKLKVAIAAACGVDVSNVILQGFRVTSQSRRLLSDTQSIQITVVVEGSTTVTNMTQAMLRAGIRQPMAFTVEEAHWVFRQHH